MKATAKDLRFHSKEILEAAMRGEEVVITYRGTPTARVLPFKSPRKKRVEPDGLFGIWKGNSKVAKVDEFVRSLRKGRFEC